MWMQENRRTSLHNFPDRWLPYLYDKPNNHKNIKIKKTTVIICDNDVDALSRIQQGLQGDEAFRLETITDASKLIETATSRFPALVIVNPEMRAFNEYDVCKKLMKDKNIPVLLLLDKNSTLPSQIDDCEADDVLTKPVDLDNLLFLVRKHIAVHQ
jgi:sigma-B regulation protein RsbU (phosphoserine phosphatase)